MLSFFKVSSAQFTFHKLYGFENYFYDAGRSVIQASDNTFIVVGSSLENYDGMYILKLNEYGDTTWSIMHDFYTVGGDIPKSVIQKSDGSFIISGFAADSTEGASSGFLLKLDNNGSVEWLKPIDEGFNDRHIMHKQTTDGGFIIGGYNYDTTATYTQVFLIKADSLGNIQWQQEYGAANYNDYLKSIDLTPDGGYIIGGDFENPSTNSYDMFLLKTDSLGNQEWEKSYGTTVDEGDGFAISTLDKGFIIVGGRKTTDNTFNGYIIKTDSLGNTQWSKIINTPGVNDYFHQVRQLPDGSYIIGGTKPDLSGTPNGVKAWLLKLNQQGDTVWSKTYNYYGGSKHTYMEDLNLTNDGGFIATGYIINNSLPAKNDLWLLKTDSMGNTCTIDTTTYEGCWSYSCYTVNSEITADSDTVYLTQGATVQFGTISNFGTSWQWDFGDTITSTEQFPQHSYTHTGTKTVQLITNNDYCSDTAYYTITVFLDVSSQMVVERSRNAHFTIFPNPASEQLTVTCSPSARHCEARSNLIIYNLFGKEVLTTELITEKQLIDISALKQGIYYYKIVNNGELTDGGKLVIVR